MSAKPIQISLDTDLLQRIDADQETRERGRSAFVRSAIEVYLKAKERQQIERQIVRAYGGRGDEMAAEIADLIETQEWPDD